ncbi:hypothetical protein [Streptomyces sp. NPDC059957]|uniref:hypothetical protein n=1 Tax=Streptomyces sp. NPDC059957 TaxID=3347016 RepID=UPI0036610DAE
MITLAAAGLAGCSPAPEPLLAIERTATGDILLVIAPCSGYRALGLYVFSDSDTGPSEVWSLSNKERIGSLGEVKFFTTPVGWEVNDTTLTELRDPGLYVAKIDGAMGTRSLNGRMAFTAEKINKLNAGEVLTGTKGEKVMDREQFVKPSSGRCKP